MKKSLTRSLIGAAGAAALLAGCASGPTSYAPVTINIAHINDHHSQLEPFANVELNLSGHTASHQGRQRHWQAIYSPMLDEQGVPDRILTIVRDVTEQVEARAWQGGFVAHQVL